MKIHRYLFLLAFMIVVLKSHGQKLAQVQEQLDSIIQLDPFPANPDGYGIDTLIPLNNGMKVMVVSSYYECNGDMCNRTDKGLITAKGDTLKAVFYDIIQLTSGEVILVGLEKDIQINVNLKVTKVYDHFGKFVRGLAVFVENGQYGLCSESGEVILTPTYDYLESLDDLDRIAANKDGSWTILDKKDLLHDDESDSEKPWDYMERAVELLKVENPQSRLWALINEKGKQITPYKYEEIITFS